MNRTSRDFLQASFLTFLIIGLSHCGQSQEQDVALIDVENQSLENTEGEAFELVGPSRLTATCEKDVSNIYSIKIVWEAFETSAELLQIREQIIGIAGPVWIESDRIEPAEQRAYIAISQTPMQHNFKVRGAIFGIEMDDTDDQFSDDVTIPTISCPPPIAAPLPIPLPPAAPL